MLPRLSTPSKHAASPEKETGIEGLRGAPCEGEDMVWLLASRSSAISVASGNPYANAIMQRMVFPESTGLCTQ